LALLASFAHAQITKEKRTKQHPKLASIFVATAIGWFLMGPPITDEEIQSRNIVSHKRPVSEWIHYFSYDSAKECQSALDRLRDQVLKDPKEPQDSEQNRLYATVVYARCLPSDAVTLK
jgi:hypothetical protein